MILISATEILAIALGAELALAVVRLASPITAPYCGRTTPTRTTPLLPIRFLRATIHPLQALQSRHGSTGPESLLGGVIPFPGLQLDLTLQEDQGRVATPH